MVDDLAVWSNANLLAQQRCVATILFPMRLSVHAIEGKKTDWRYCNSSPEGEHRRAAGRNRPINRYNHDDVLWQSDELAFSTKWRIWSSNCCRKLFVDKSQQIPARLPFAMIVPFGFPDTDMTPPHLSLSNAERFFSGKLVAVSSEFMSAETRYGIVLLRTVNRLSYGEWTARM